jgi:membrane-associated PAP2 superfamily phosphatase
LGEAGLFLAALLALGPGLIVNGIFKPYLCRPRPHQVTDFGGQQTFVAAWGMGTSVEGKSFPCGHASMGFYLMAPAFLLYRRHRRLAIGFVLLGLVCGTAIGLARIADGDHFPSDVLWAAGMVYLSGLGLAFLFQWVQQFFGRSAAATSAGERGTGVASIPLVPAGGVAGSPARRDAA